MNPNQTPEAYSPRDCPGSLVPVPAELQHWCNPITVEASDRRSRPVHKSGDKSEPSNYRPNLHYAVRLWSISSLAMFPSTLHLRCSQMHSMASVKGFLPLPNSYQQYMTGLPPSRSETRLTLSSWTSRRPSTGCPINGFVLSFVTMAYQVTHSAGSCNFSPTDNKPWLLMDPNPLGRMLHQDCRKAL